MKMLDFKWLSVMLFFADHDIDEPFGEGLAETGCMV
jgi:hypothetical protein